MGGIKLCLVALVALAWRRIADSILILLVVYLELEPEGPLADVHPHDAVFGLRSKNTRDLVHWSKKREGGLFVRPLKC